FGLEKAPIVMPPRNDETRLLSIFSRCMGKVAWAATVMAFFGSVSVVILWMLFLLGCRNVTLETFLDASVLPYQEDSKTLGFVGFYLASPFLENLFVSVVSVLVAAFAWAMSPWLGYWDYITKCHIPVFFLTLFLACCFWESKPRSLANAIFNLYGFAKLYVPIGVMVFFSIFTFQFTFTVANYGNMLLTDSTDPYAFLSIQQVLVTLYLGLGSQIIRFAYTRIMMLTPIWKEKISYSRQEEIVNNVVMSALTNL
ncbi:hypothetical protein HK101_011227, partial [Irineochytrium annulatum]